MFTRWLRESGNKDPPKLDIEISELVSKRKSLTHYSWVLLIYTP